MQISAAGYQTPGAIYINDSLEEAKAYEKAMTTYSAKEASGIAGDKESPDEKPGAISDSVNISAEARALAQTSAVPKIEGAENHNDSAGFGASANNGESGNQQQRTAQADEEKSGSVQYGGGAQGSGESGSNDAVERIRKQIQEVQKQIQEVQARVQEASQEVQKAEEQSAEAMSAQAEMEAAQVELNSLTSQLLTLQKALMDAMKGK